MKVEYANTINMLKISTGTLHGTAEETARQIRALSYKVFIVTW